MQANEINIVIFWVCVAIGVVVYAAIIWSLVVYRKSKKQEVSFHKNTATEIAWTVIPLLIIIAMTIPAAKLLTRLYGSVNTLENESVAGVLNVNSDSVSAPQVKGERGLIISSINKEEV